jgi:hypothetical protein
MTEEHSLREMLPRYQGHAIPSRAVVIIMRLKEIRRSAAPKWWQWLFD